VLLTSPDSALMPGTMFLVTEGMTLPCDAVLLSGKVVVDESMLTGESVPVSKSPIDLASLGSNACDSAESRTRSMLSRASVLGQYCSTVVAGDGASFSDSTTEKVPMVILNNQSIQNQDIDIAGKLPGNVLFGGTRVRACYGDHCIAVAYRTGFRSAKGQLVSSLLLPKDGFNNFVSDALRIILVTTITISLLYIGIALRLEYLGASSTEAFFYYLDAITIAVPPGLTACLTIATSIAINRMKAKDIFVSDTTRVNFGGIITAACFDKTGTLTESSLQLLGAVCTTQATLGGNTSEQIETPQEALHDYRVHNGSDGAVKIGFGVSIGIPFFCQEIMATCHGLDLQGFDAASARGDPLEEELLQASQWRLMHATASRNGQLVAFPPMMTYNSDVRNGFLVLKHFEFTPEKLRAASVVREPSGRIVYLMKGSPEVVVGMCDPSTVPSELTNTMSGLAKEGLRVIAIAFKVCATTEEEALGQTQDQFETSGEGLRLVGLLYLSSSLKKDTKRTIFRLQRAKIHVNMITGDHIHTAISVGGSCGILKYKTEHSAPQHPQSRRLFIVDQDSITERTVILDARTELPVTNMSLPELIFDAARSYVTDFGIDDSVFDFSSIAPEGVGDDGTDDDHDADIDMGGVLNPIRRFAENISTPSIVVHDSKAVSSKILVEIAVTGKGLHAVFREHPSHTSLSLIRYAKVFARTKPYDKKYIVESLLKSCPAQLLQMARADTGLNLCYNGGFVDNQFWKRWWSPNSRQSLSSDTNNNPEDNLSSDDELLQTMEVLFCGDGANDMIALRAATIGVSLCDAETSVAAPVTSREQTPGAVVDVLKEGRCSLVTAYVLILFNMNYAVIQLCLAFSMYYYGLQIGDYMYLTQDLFFAFFLGLAISYSGPTQTLSEQLPPKRFFVPFIITRLVLSIVSFASFQLLSLYVLTLQDFYTPFETDNPLTETYSYETSAIFNLSLGQLLIAAIVSTIGKPFRETWYKNRYFIWLLGVLFVYVLFQIFGGDNYFLTSIMQVKPMPVYYGFIEIAMMILHLVVCFAIRSFCEHFFSLKNKIFIDFRLFSTQSRSSLLSSNTPRAVIAKSSRDNNSQLETQSFGNEKDNDFHDRKPLLDIL
jgi:magnesium-transporting ATPase (P-type)